MEMEGIPSAVRAMQSVPSVVYCFCRLNNRESVVSSYVSYPHTISSAT